MALDNGYRLIDTAAIYKNEAEIGTVLKEYLDAGKIKREDIFVTTKVHTMRGIEDVCTHLNVI